MFGAIDYVRWWLWKRRARKVPQDQQGSCAMCGKSIFPGDLVAVATSGEVVHAGFHFSLDEREAFCESGDVGNAFWTTLGKPTGLFQSALGLAFETGKPVWSEAGPDGVSHRVVGSQ